MNDMLAGLATGLTVCRVAVETHGGLMTSLFLTGLIGSLSHCAGMCGPFVLSQVAARMETIPLERMGEWRRLTGAALLPYHLGRAITYSGLGAVAGAAAGALAGWTGLRYLAAGLLVLAALFLLGMALPRLKLMLGRGKPATGGGWAGWIARLARPLLTSPTGWRGLALGAALGFIPCGLLYAALAAAAASGDAVSAAMAMASFCAGTVPALFAVGVLGQFAIGRWRQDVLRWAPLLLAGNAVMLGVMAYGLAA